MIRYPDERWGAGTKPNTTNCHLYLRKQEINPNFLFTFLLQSLFLVYVLNYSWVFGGIWQMLKRALPESARERVSFPSSVDELHEYFDREELSTGRKRTTQHKVSLFHSLVFAHIIHLTDNTSLTYPKKKMTEFGGLDTYQYDSDTCEAFQYFGYSSLSLQPGTPALSRVNSCDSIYFDAIQTPMHSPGLRPHEGLSFLSMTPMMPLAPPSGSNGGSGLSRRPSQLRTRSNSIPFIDLNNANNNNTSKQITMTHSKTTPMRAPLLKHSKSSAHIPSFMITPSIQSDLPTQYPLSRRDRTAISKLSGSSSLDPNNPKNGKGNLFYRLILRPNSVFMRLASKQANARQKVVKVVKRCADKMLRTDMKTLMYWVMALIMLRGEVWQLIAATAVKVLTVVGDGDELLL